MKKSVGEVRGDVATATANLLRAWEAVPAVVRLELRTVAPELVPALDRWVAVEAALLTARQEQELAARSMGEALTAALAARHGLTVRAHAVAAVHEGMPR